MDNNRKSRVFKVSFLFSHCAEYGEPIRVCFLAHFLIFGTRVYAHAAHINHPPQHETHPSASKPTKRDHNQPNKKKKKIQTKPPTTLHYSTYRLWQISHLTDVYKCLNMDKICSEPNILVSMIWNIRRVGASIRQRPRGWGGWSVFKKRGRSSVLRSVLSTSW